MRLSTSAAWRANSSIQVIEPFDSLTAVAGISASALGCIRAGGSKQVIKAASHIAVIPTTLTKDRKLSRGVGSKASEGFRLRGPPQTTRRPMMSPKARRPKARRHKARRRKARPKHHRTHSSRKQAGCRRRGSVKSVLPLPLPVVDVPGAPSKAATPQGALTGAQARHNSSTPGNALDTSRSGAGSTSHVGHAPLNGL